MPRFTDQPLQRQILIVAVLLVLPLLGGTLWSASVGYQERSEELREQAASTAATAAAYLRQRLEGVDSLAATLGRHPSVQSLDTDACNRLFADLLPQYPFILNITLTGADGYNHGTALTWTAAEPAYSGDQPYIKRVLATDAPAVGEYQLGRISGKPTVILGYPVHDGSRRLAGVLGLGLDLTTLQSFFASIPLPRGSVVTLTDRTSLVLARSLDADKFIGRRVDPQSPSDPRSVPPVVVRTGLDGVERIFGNTAIERGPWLLSVGIPTEVAAARAQAGWRRHLITVLLGAAAYIGLTLLLARAVTRPVKHFETLAQRIARGELSPPERVEVPNRELARLQDAFLTMTHNLQEAREAIERQVAQERRMRQEVQLLQRQVVRQERLAAVGLLVAGIAHELNNPLQGILGHTELLQADRTLPPEVQESLRLISAESVRAREIIRNLSRFGRQQTEPPALVSIPDLIAAVVQLRRRELESRGIELELEIESTPPVQAAFSELQQVLLNFIVNAQQALESSDKNGGRILLKSVLRGNAVRLEVADDGPGVGPEDEPKLFQPFFTTKPVGKGTGLGLSVSYGIIDSYGGAIGYQTNEWGGATFFFELPVAVNVAV